MSRHVDDVQLNRRLATLARQGEQCLADPPAARRPRKVRMPAGLPNNVAVKAISHLAHGEVLTARLCDWLAKALPMASARHCMTVQGAEERLHASLYDAYLTELGDKAKPSPAIALMEHEANAWDGPPDALILAIHVLLESEALALQQSATRWFPCPGFQDINRRISRDEGRHLSFGRQYLSAALPQYSVAERQRMFRWLQAAWLRITRAVVSDLGPGWSPMVLGFGAWRRQRWACALAEFETVGLIEADARETKAAP